MCQRRCRWYNKLGPGPYVAAGNAVRGYMRDLAPAALDATEACWRAVEQQLGSGEPGGEELLHACRALFGALFEGLRHLGTTSAERINDPAVPREMRSFAGLNILWTGLSRVMTALPPEALQQLLSGSAVQSVLRSLLRYLAAEARALAASQHSDYETRLKVSRFWLQHAARVAQAHPCAAGACWDELTAAAAEVYGHIASCASAAVAAEAEALPANFSTAAGATQRPPGRQNQQLMARKARDLDAAVALKLTSVLAVVLDAGVPATGGPGGEAGAAAGGEGPASPQQLEALDRCGMASVAPSLDVPHQLAAAALALLAACAEQQAGGRDADSFTAGCALLCSWGPAM
ncbi:hypothetical protein GPECTOR_11g224 [Gonium pectorale]|uniref:Uncharacterized protein n=1 Tax=Gonium pectorale TaxID=33097 RepID=A0A150GPP6_GONPE|nr:hypothetical protein GPECTOR_11g224 [Gonium pectorale]|eukprot:KXZ51781.1 hypothetical protein GPECTOR_11g224 [Gonium pectorale]